MFVVSFTKKTVLKIIIPVAVIISGIIIYGCFSDGFDKSSVNTGSVSVLSSHDVINYISTLGWEVDAEPEEIKEIVIPHQFDDVYKKYNELQKAQGFDLSKYSGERVKLWSFIVRNYPGYENNDCIRINLLVYDGCIIGGDVCSVEIDGFMHGLSGEQNG